MSHHRPFFPFVVTLPVCLALATGRAVERPGPTSLKGFPTDTTGHCERRCRLFGPVSSYTTLGRLLARLGVYDVPQWVQLWGVSRQLFITPPRSMSLHKIVTFSSIGQNAGNVKRLIFLSTCPTFLLSAQIPPAQAEAARGHCVSVRRGTHPDHAGRPVVSIVRPHLDQGKPLPSQCPPFVPPVLYKSFMVVICP